MDLRMIFAQCTDELVDNYVNAGLLDHETYKSWLAQTYFQTKNHDKALLHIAECAPVGTEEKKRCVLPFSLICDKKHSQNRKGKYCHVVVQKVIGDHVCQIARKY